MKWREGLELLPAAQQLPTLRRWRSVARQLAFVFVATLVFVALAPWRQNISGGGKVIAFTPNERPQEVLATVGGRIAEWHVIEGQQVSEGDRLVTLADNDPGRLERLEEARGLAEARLEALRQQVQAQEQRVEAMRDAQDARIAAARAEVNVSRATLTSRREMLEAARLAAETARRQGERIIELTGQGLASERERELATLGQTQAEARLRSAQAGVQGAEQALQTKRAALAQAQASTEASLQSAEASLRSARTSLASGQSGLLSVQTRLAQQEAQNIVAPRDGVVQRIHVQQGMQVRAGHVLALLVPENHGAAVELYVDGNDAALIQPGASVRLQFEGWPGIQFSGWPSVAVGTFGGVVSFVDAAGDDSGDFRVVVVPDDADAEWPDPRYLRQGTRAKGWLLLSEVRLGFELWRQLNGFPPAFDHAPGSDS